jgi:hypothetical protein
VIRSSARHARVSRSHAVLNFNRATNRIDDAAELDNRAVAGALYDAAMMGGDGGVNQITAEPTKARESALFIRTGESAVTDHVGDQDCRELPGLGHWTLQRSAM